MTSPFPPLSAPQVRAVAALANHRRSQMAAAALGVSQPSLSRHIQQAEARLGQALFERGWSGSEATAFGDQVVRQCQRALVKLERVDSTLAEMGARAPRLATYARWRHLRVIADVVHTESASLSAARLALRQPAISQTLRQGRDFADIALFTRRSAGLEPTPAARVIATAWAGINADLAQIARPVDTDSTPGGRVAVGMLPFSGQNLVLDAFAALSQRDPKLRLIAIPGSYSMLSQSLMRGEIDLIMGGLRSPAPQAEFVEERLYDERFTMIARRDHPCFEGPMTLDALVQHHWSVAPHGTPVRRYFEQIFRDAPTAPRTQSVEIFSFANAEQMIMASESIALLCYNDERLRDLHPSLRALSVPLPDPTIAVGITRLRTTTPSAAVSAFLAALRQRIIDLKL